MRRRNVVLGIVMAVLVGAPVAAYAAGLTSVSFGGEAGFINATISIKLLSVKAGAATGDLDCGSAKMTGDSSFQVNPVARRVAGEGGRAAAVPGTCDIALKIRNTGTVALLPAVTTTQIPAGWGTAVVDPKPIAKGQDGVTVVRVSVTRTAVAGRITGKLVSSADSGLDPAPPMPFPDPPPPADPVPMPVPMPPEPTKTPPPFLGPVDPLPAPQPTTPAPAPLPDVPASQPADPPAPGA